MKKPRRLIQYTLFIIIAGINQYCMAQPVAGKAKHTAHIDTMCYRYAFPPSDTVTAFIPQLRMPYNPNAADRINKDIFQLSKLYAQKPITPPFLKPASLQFKYNDISSAMAYMEKLADTLPQESDNEKPDYQDSHDEYYEVNHLGETFLSIGYQYQTLPYKGQYQYFYSSLHVNIRNGDRLKFSDFISIHPDTLTKLLKKYAVLIERYDQYNIESQELYSDMPIAEHVHALFDSATTDVACSDFFYHSFNGELYLCFKIKCYGPHIFTIGIKLSHVKQYIVFPEFKNSYLLWGKNAQSLIGANIAEIPLHINLEDYVLSIGGGYQLSDERKKFQSTFSIQYAHNKNSSFYIFTELKPNQKELIVTDVLEFKKDHNKNTKMIDSYCYAPSSDPEIIARVKHTGSDPAFYHQIIEAWRANRLTGKFEKVNPKLVTKCANEGYGSE